MKHFVFSDIHGCNFLFRQILDYLNNLKEEWHCWFLGDACDRGGTGEESLFIINTLMNDERITYLKGNHEDLLTMALYESLESNWKERMFNEHSYIHAYCMNGGTPLFRYIKDNWTKEQIENFILNLYNLKVFDSFENYDFCHAGCFKKDFGIDVGAMLWERKHFSEPWFENRTLFHGHTYIAGLRYYYPAGINFNGLLQKNLPVEYNTGKIDVDSACFASNHISVYCLEDKNYITFYNDIELIKEK